MNESLHLTDRDAQPVADVARSLGVSVEAVSLARSCELIDLHIDTFLPMRLIGYDPLVWHAGGPFGRHMFGHLDLPRARDGGLSGAMWSITTNPARSVGGRWDAFLRNVAWLRDTVERSQGALRLVRTCSEYRQARATGAIALMLSIQGGHALRGAPHGVASVPDRLLTRVTLVHLTNSCYGATSCPFGKVRRDRGLT
ncbi:MAG: membrane dipeptidase, partial [Polyangiaceae bacterium]|nr:membrane dipeptidase [Polyangiaceae bacterium]